MYFMGDIKYGELMNRSGFTLVELSIVLVIIGLLAAGILVGKDLIHAARVRAQVSQLTKYSTAVHTFRSKYNGLPGDLLATQAQELGFTARSGVRGHGDGNGTLEGCDPANPNGIYLGCEIVLFWKDLSQANLIPSSLTAAIDDVMVSNSFQDTLTYFPASKINDGVAILTGMDNANQGVFVFLRMTSAATIDSPNNVTVEDAYAIDSVMDDGQPTTGSAQLKLNGGLIPVNFFNPPMMQFNALCIDANQNYNLSGDQNARCVLSARTGAF